MMEARILLDSENDAYRKLSERIGHVFSRLEWYGCFGPEIMLCGIFSDNQELIGGFAFSRKTVMGFPFFGNPPFTPSIGLFYHNPAENAAKRLGNDKEVLDAVARFFRNYRFPIQRYCLPPDIIDMQPFYWNGFKVIPHLTYRIGLQVPENTLYSNISAKLRNNIKKAANDGISTRQISAYAGAESLILNTYIRNDTGINPEHILNIIYKFANPQNSFAFGAYKNDILIAVSFFLHDDRTVYYMFGGYSEEFKHEGAGASTLWDAIRYAKALGLTTFDFEGSMIPRIEKYFRSFGGEIRNYFTLNRAPLIVEMALKLFKRSIF
jgi:hypothetical protein